MIHVSIYLILCCVGVIYSSTLTRQQLVRINRCLSSPHLCVKQKSLLQNVLYTRFEGWAIKIGSNFKKFHHYKCKHIPYSEISIYSRKGLLNAIQKYNPTSENAAFHIYAAHHIRGELYRGMTELSPIANVSRKQLRNKGAVYQKATYLGNYDCRPVNNHYNQTNDEIWEQIHEICIPFTRRCIMYKFDYDFKQIRTNEEIATLMVCSEESVRKAILTYFINNFLGHILVRSYRDSNSDGWIQSPKC